MPWTGAEVATDVTIVARPIVEEFSDPISPQRWVKIDTDGSILLTIPGLVRFLVRHGKSVTVEILRDEVAQGWRLFLLGSVLSMLCHQRRLLPLHAATVKIGGRNIAIAGHSGMGKSTLAFSLMQRGHGLLSDDVTVLEVNSAQCGWIMPAFPRLKLWYDTCRALGVEPETLPRVRDDLPKVDYGRSIDFDYTPGPLDGIVILNEAAELKLVPEPKSHAVTAILGHVSRRRIGHLLGCDRSLFAQAAMLSSKVEVLQLSRPKQFELLPAAAVLIEEHFGR